MPGGINEAMPRLPLALAATLALALSACSGPSSPESSPDTPTDRAASTQAAPSPSSTDPMASPASPPEPVTLPATPVGEAAQWVLDTLAAESGPTAEEAEERFGAEFLSQVPAAQVGMVFDQLRAGAPFTLVKWEGGELQGAGDLESSAMPMTMMLEVQDAKIAGLVFVPNETANSTTAAEASTELQARASQSSFLLADDECTPLEARDTDTPLPMGSMFKLYVLGAVVAAVEGGQLSWDEELTLTDELKSLPSGDLRGEPSGTLVAVEDAALKMISESDNTATDLLIHAVGREAVEAQLEAMGHHAPELNTPFLTTREAFQLAGDADLRTLWSAASGGYDNDSPEVSEAQRAVLEALPAWDLTFDEALMADPFWDDGIDWFATAEDICAAHVHLQQLAESESGAPVRGILATNPGIEVAGAGYIGFKGGSAPGELGLSFYVEKGDEARVLVLQTAGGTPHEVPQPGWLASLAEAALNDTTS